MKKFLSLALAFIMVMSLAACGNKDIVSKTNNESVKASDKLADGISGAKKEIKEKLKEAKNEVDTKLKDIKNTEDDNKDSTELNPDDLVITTDNEPGAKLQDTVVEVAHTTLDFSNPEKDEELEWVSYITEFNIEESNLSAMYTGIGEFETREGFDVAWEIYKDTLIPEIQSNGILTDIFESGEVADGENLFAMGYNNVHSLDIAARMDGYQNVTYTYIMNVASEPEENYDRYDYSGFVNLIKEYTGVVISTGDIRAMQEKCLEGDTSTMSSVKLTNADNSIEITLGCSDWSDGAHSYVFNISRLIHKWAPLYDEVTQ